MSLKNSQCMRNVAVSTRFSRVRFNCGNAWIVINSNWTDGERSTDVPWLPAAFSEFVRIKLFVELRSA